MQIDYLANHSELIPTIAQWHHQEWGHFRPEKTVNWRIENLRGQTDPATIPLTFVALSELGPVGSASLVWHDMPERQELSPWLASVFVHAQQRNQGIGSTLVNRAVKEANTLNFPILYLFTFDKKHLYEHLGWKFMERLDYLDHEVTIMKTDTHAVEK
jgi:GNAT superfamily N-acetyltransferase